MKKRLVKICCVWVVLVILLCGSFSALPISVSDTSAVNVTGMNNRNPNPPEITGPSTGTINTRYFYSFLLTDPDGDSLKTILIEWGGLDSDNTTYICFLCEGGPLPNGSIFEYGHRWGTAGTYTIRAKVWDMYDNESDWGTLTVTMPYSSPRLLPRVFQLLFERFPDAFLLLRHLMGD